MITKSLCKPERKTQSLVIHLSEKVFIKIDFIMQVAERLFNSRGRHAVKCIYWGLCWSVVSCLYPCPLTWISLLSLILTFKALWDKGCLFTWFVQCLPQWNSCSGIQQCCWYNHRLCRDELLCFSYGKASHDVRDQAAILLQSLLFHQFTGIVFPDRMGRLTKVEKGFKTQQEFTGW